jgi:flagellar protein FliO/FliZ
MKRITILLGFVLLKPSVSVGITTDNATTVKTLATGDILNWSIGLVIVLGLFFLLAWLMKKLSGGTVAGSGKMQILGGLSLGMREKIVLLKVGDQQLVLGVSPGRIEKLHVLQGEDCLVPEPTTRLTETGSNFASKLADIMQGKNHD